MIENSNIDMHNIPKRKTIFMALAELPSDKAVWRGAQRPDIGFRQEFR
ncbi:hypothetical protein [Mesorhizobium erdmanii]|nr:MULTISPECIES: hypothetical protein [Mesorhizobium]